MKKSKYTYLSLKVFLLPVLMSCSLLLTAQPSSALIVLGGWAYGAKSNILNNTEETCGEPGGHCVPQGHKTTFQMIVGMGLVIGGTVAQIWLPLNLLERVVLLDQKDSLLLPSQFGKQGYSAEEAAALSYFFQAQRDSGNLLACSSTDSVQSLCRDVRKISPQASPWLVQQILEGCFGDSADASKCTGE